MVSFTFSLAAAAEPREQTLVLYLRGRWSAQVLHSSLLPFHHEYSRRKQLPWVTPLRCKTCLYSRRRSLDAVNRKYDDVSSIQVLLAQTRGKVHKYTCEESRQNIRNESSHTSRLLVSHFFPLSQVAEKGAAI